MKTNVRGKKLLLGSVAGFLVLSASLLLMPLPGLGFLPGVLFWAGLLAGIAAQFLLHLKLGRDLKKGKPSRCGLLTFGANRLAKLADIGLLVSVLASVVTLNFSPAAYICYVALAAAVFCFCMHCVFNGRTFGHVMGHDRSRQQPDRVNKSEKGDGTR